MRVGEITQLEVRHLKWDEMGRLKLTIPAENTKGGLSGREVVLGGSIPLKVRQYLNMYKFKKGFVFRNWVQWKEQALFREGIKEGV